MGLDASTALAGGFASLAQELMDFKDQVPAPSISALAFDLNHFDAIEGSSNLGRWTADTHSYPHGQANSPAAPPTTAALRAEPTSKLIPDNKKAGFDLSAYDAAEGSSWHSAPVAPPPKFSPMEIIPCLQRCCGYKCDPDTYAKCASNCKVQMGQGTYAPSERSTKTEVPSAAATAAATSEPSTTASTPAATTKAAATTAIAAEPTAATTAVSTSLAPAKAPKEAPKEAPAKAPKVTAKVATAPKEAPVKAEAPAVAPSATATPPPPGDPGSKFWAWLSTLHSRSVAVLSN